MKLQYRGVTYEQNHTEAVGTTQGKFRGRKWFSSHKKQSTTKPEGLVYRGVAVK